MKVGMDINTYLHQSILQLQLSCSISDHIPWCWFIRRQNKLFAPPSQVVWPHKIQYPNGVLLIYSDHGYTPTFQYSEQDGLHGLHTGADPGFFVNGGRGRSPEFRTKY